MANRCLAYVRKMYNWALSKDLVEFNPCAGIPRPGKEQQRDLVLSEDEIKAIRKALDKEKPIMAATFRLRLLTAQRGGEVHSIRWNDIDREWWTIPEEFAKNGLSHRVCRYHHRQCGSLIRCGSSRRRQTKRRIGTKASGFSQIAGIEQLAQWGRISTVHFRKGRAPLL